MKPSSKDAFPGLKPWAVLSDHFMVKIGQTPEALRAPWHFSGRHLHRAQNALRNCAMFNIINIAGPGMKPTAILLISCPDRKGIVATISGLLYRMEPTSSTPISTRTLNSGLFFMRVEWDLDGFDLDAATFARVRVHCRRAECASASLWEVEYSDPASQPPWRFCLPAIFTVYSDVLHRQANGGVRLHNSAHHFNRDHQPAEPSRGSTVCHFTMCP